MAGVEWEIPEHVARHFEPQFRVGWVDVRKVFLTSAIALALTMFLTFGALFLFIFFSLGSPQNAAFPCLSSFALGAIALFSYSLSVKTPPRIHTKVRVKESWGKLGVSIDGAFPSFFVSTNRHISIIKGERYMGFVLAKFTVGNASLGRHWVDPFSAIIDERKFDEMVNLIKSVGNEVTVHEAGDG